ncbi:hypothetical protein C3747_33g1455c [Trypanosoma cruzi]|uniref:Uncharacterized protein n=2 Tax=Trypanosoma cruzi TaxID=5693 RepID=Q4DRX8_TRYCC|nr:hypothetical protein, conserved [Trypanosoma cruzi]EAN95287.1 hypothetical protein, conserved [Trypanosoma cruzi]KAF8291413.1 hypothetical protein TcYC6_0123860 [Trypanosoma cruzi]PWV14758.1 hypothetical protein C3747_33g1455c [Trypanosoma cruzi]|eukprot:XP_817138.1 hypothetical protein [Trypanosoma cruzi strain CL Brener]
MSSAQVEELERRASAAEVAIEELKKSMQARPQSGAENNAALELRLRELLKLMEEDRLECEVIRVQRDELKEENERLRAQVMKHEYRIKHLLQTINEIESGKQKN